MYRRTGLGDTSSSAPPLCVFPGSWSDPFCIDALFSGEYMPGYQNQVAPMVTSAYVAGAVPQPPPEAYDSGVSPGGGPSAQSASDTINNQISQAQANAVANALAAAAAQAASNAPAQPSACLSNPSSLACWLSQNSTVLIWVGVGIGALMLMKAAR